MRPAQLIADGIFGAITAVWAGLSVYFGYRYLRPEWGHVRLPQHLILMAACLGWVAFVLREHNWLPHASVSFLEAIAITGAGLALLGVYLYEVEGPRRRR